MLAICGNLFSSHGRIGRLRYLGCSILILLVGGLLGMSGIAVAVKGGQPIPGGLLALAAFVGYVWAAVSLDARRLHDMGLSARHLVWICALNVVSGSASMSVPLGYLAGMLSFGVNAWLLLARGETGPNRFGPPAPSRRSGIAAPQSI